MPLFLLVTIYNSVLAIFFFVFFQYILANFLKVLVFEGVEIGVVFSFLVDTAPLFQVNITSVSAV